MGGRVAIFHRMARAGIAGDGCRESSYLGASEGRLKGSGSKGKKLVLLL